MMNQTLSAPTSARITVVAIGAVTLAFVLYARVQDKAIERETKRIRAEVDRVNANFNSLVDSLS